ncbi:LacI family DNA-binding transcriptional regulator [Microbacterium sp. bgisy207]|uniref:LacI family DNA-binding transcriptional regulator n=1 Tax=Microbacterium sp. bgisy207 TaxID=3413800 RepID=UPI003EBD138D
MAKINEVAEAAGVSISTVSYALSGKRPVSPATRKRIEDAVAKLGYSPNASARMLAGRRTNIFALTEPLRTDTHVPTHMAFVLATAVAARRHDYDILLLTEEQAVSGMSRVASSGLADAILVLDVAPDDERVALARSIATPTVFIGVPDDHDGLVCVDLDFEAAARTAVDKLAALGHTRIGMLGMTETAYDKSNFPPRVRAAYERRAAELGVETFFRASGRVQTDRNGCRAALSELLAAGVTALILHSNEDAHAIVLSELDQRQISVPYDLSLISVGNSFDIDTLARPIDALPLIPAESCNRAVELALESLDGDRPEPGLHLVAPTYLSRDSIGPRVRSADGASETVAGP